MPLATVEEVLSVPKDKLFDVITRYEDYPQFVTGVTKASVARNAPGKAMVHYTMNMLKEITYSIDVTENKEAGKIHWVLVESGFMKKNNGGWTLSDAGNGKTKVLYE